MSQLAYILSGSKIARRKMRVGISVTSAGVPLIGPTANNEGVLLGATTTSVDAVGMSIDTATYNTAQQSDGSDPTEWVDVIINPDAVWQSRLSGGATTGTALTAYYNTVASSTGVLLTLSATSGGATVDTTNFDDCPIFCYSGANAGLYRRAEPADGTDINLTQAFQYAIAVDDRFFGCPVTEGGIASVTWVTDLTEINAAVTVSANSASTWRAVDLILNDVGNDGLYKSYANVICCDHQYAGSSLA